MRILIIARTHNSWQNGVLIYNEMSRQNMDVYLASTSDSIDKLLRMINRYKISWVMVTGAGSMSPGSLILLKKVVRISIWDADWLVPARHRIWNGLKNIPNLIVTSVAGVADSLEGYAECVRFIPQFFDSFYCAPTYLFSRDIDVCFIGSSAGSNRRGQWIKQLIKDVGLQVWGTVPGVAERPVYGGEMANVYAKSKIVIDIEREQSLRMMFQTSDRIFKAMGCGAMYLTYPIKGIEKFFKPGIDLGIYDNTYESLLKEIVFYINSDELRVQIAESGRAKVMKYHILEKRVNEYVQAMRDAE